MKQQHTIFGEPERKSTFFQENLSGPKPLIKNSSGKSSKATGKKKKVSKDEEAHAKLEKKAEKLAEDPFVTSAEMKNMDGGSKEKEEKVDKDDSEDDQQQTAQEENKEIRRDLEILASRADKVLLHAKTIFPFDFFGSTITIDANKVNIRIKTFFFTETVTSILLKEIMDVRVQASLFFGKLIIDYGPHPLKIKSVYIPSLWKKDALKAKEIIEGNLVLYRAENIDTTKLKPEETIDEVMEIGKVEERE